MVRGLVTSLQFPYALFPAKVLKAPELFSLLWRTIERLSAFLGFTVLTVTCDGAKSNRKMFKLHSLQKILVHKTLNIFRYGENQIFFISDPPHLIKTARNCFASPKRTLWVRISLHATFIVVQLLLL